MKRIERGVLFSTLFFILIFSPWIMLSGVATAQAIKIGVIGPMNFVQGKGHWNGATLAAEEMNAQGGLQVGIDDCFGVALNARVRSKGARRAAQHREIIMSQALRHIDQSGSSPSGRRCALEIRALPEASPIILLCLARCLTNSGNQAPSWQDYVKKRLRLAAHLPSNDLNPTDILAL